MFFDEKHFLFGRHFDYTLLTLSFYHRIQTRTHVVVL